jgi:hypothetical protein
MTSHTNRRIQACVLTAALLVPAATAFGNDWTKPQSRTRGAVIGGAVGTLAGPPGVVAGAAIGNGVQSMRHHASHHRHHRHHRTR